MGVSPVVIKPPNIRKCEDKTITTGDEWSEAEGGKNKVQVRGGPQCSPDANPPIKKFRCTVEYVPV